MRLGKLLYLWRVNGYLNMRDAAVMLGIGTSTLCRIENGEQCDSKALMRILNWLTDDPQ